MAAPIEACRICLGEPSKKNRRVIFGETFHVLSQLTQVLDYVPSPCDGLSKYVCNLCFTKLNKLHKIDFDLVNKIDSLRKEKKELLCYLREKMPAREIVSPLKTPKRQEKRVITHSPTPRKTKKSLFSIRPRTEQHNELMDLASQPPKTHVMNVQAIIPGTQRKILPKPSQELGSVLHVSKSSMSEPSTCIAVKSFTPSKLKVVYKTKKTQRIRTKLVKDVQLSEIVKSLAIHNAPKRTARAIYNSSLKDAINVQIMKELKREISYLTSTTNLSLLRRSESRCLATFSFDKVNEEVKLFAPLFHKMVSTITKESCIGTAVTSCIALKSANTHMSAFQHVIGQVLDHGGATDETIDTLAKMSISVSATRKGQQNLLERQKKHISNLLENELSTQNTCKSDIIGDNIDILRSPSQMSVEKKRQSWHWFLLVGLEKRIFATGLDNTKPIANICQVENGIFIPNMEDSSFLEQNFIYHIMQVLVKHVDTLRKYTPFIPQFISHEHIDASCRKSDYAIIDLLNKSENKSEEMIEILEYVHDKCIGKSDEETQAHLKMRVFGGDVLTNERAYSAQLALHNGTSELDRLQCVIHRPEGLHRIMNHLLFIYQQFYKVTSAGEPGTLSHLRNTVGRVDVHGPDEVIQKYRSHYAFVEDCLDAFIVGAYMHLSGTQNLQTESPLQQTMFNFLSDEQKYTFIHKLAKDILDKYVKTDIHNIRRKTDALDTQSSQLKDMYCSEKMKYVCPICNKLYKTKGGMKRHLNKEHGFSFELGDENSTTEKDHIATYRASFMTCALLLRDTNDAYKMGDGNRITVNAKFQMLLARVGKHTKYQLWLFRYLAYIKCLLTPQMAYEYMWNCSANLQGGLGRNIPNDNLVEILVQTVKKKVYCQGANASYASVRKAALTTQIQEEIKENLQSQCDKKKSGSKRPKANKTSDILEIVSELNAAQMFDSIPGREFRSFSGFEDLFTRVNVSELHSWITENRERLSYEVLN